MVEDEQKKSIESTVTLDTNVLLIFQITMLVIIPLYHEGMNEHLHLLWHGMLKGSVSAWIVGSIIGLIILFAYKKIRNVKKENQNNQKIPLAEKLLYRVNLAALLLCILTSIWLDMVHLTEYYISFAVEMSFIIFTLFFGIYSATRYKYLKNSGYLIKLVTRDNLIALSMNLVLVSALVVNNVIYKINELQTKNGSFAGRVQLLSLRGNYDDSQSWYFAKENKPKARFMVYNNNLNKKLKVKTVYEVTVYKGYFGDTIIPVKSLNNAKPLPNESAKWW